MLHANENESMSLIALAKKHNYIQITNYLSQELNTQFLNTILNNDLRSAEKFEALGADFNYRDEQKRTALHYAVQYHGIDLVSWLCIRGSAPTFADIDGNYPIIEATEKGMYVYID
jgi:ankyrin repeat protein